MNPLDHLLQLLSGTSNEPFTGSGKQTGGRIFGGQVLAQTVMAAAHSVPDDRPIHSMHGYFLRPGNPTSPIEMDVDKLRDGRSFSQRRVQAIQDGQPILSMIASFQERQVGVEHQDEMPDVPSPESLPTTADVLAGVDHPVARYWATTRPIDVRHVDQPIYLRPPVEPKPRQMVWLRTLGDMPSDADWKLHSAVLAFASDYTLLEAALRAQGLCWPSPGLKLASLDHAIWFHRPFRADEWLLYVQESPTAQAGRTLCQGKFFNRDGTHVASVSQEGMIRI